MPRSSRPAARRRTALAAAPRDLREENAEGTAAHTNAHHKPAIAAADQRHNKRARVEPPAETASSSAVHSSAAAAAASSSLSAPAAAASSSSAAAAASSSAAAADAALVAVDGETEECGICCHRFHVESAAGEEEEQKGDAADRSPCLLPCHATHSVCTDCLLRMLNAGDKAHKTLRCPICSVKHNFGAASSDSILRRLTVAWFRSDRVQLHKRERESREKAAAAAAAVAAAAAAANQCRFQSCALAPSVHCSVCGPLCALHSNFLHSTEQGKLHAFVPIAIGEEMETEELQAIIEQQAKEAREKLTREVEKKTALLQKLKSHAPNKAFKARRSTLLATIDVLQQGEAALRAQMEAESKQKAELDSKIATHTTKLEQQLVAMQRVLQLQPDRLAVEAAQLLGADSSALDAECAAVCDSASALLSFAQLHPAASLLKALADLPLLPSLPLAQQQQLQQWLGDDYKLANASCIYRASHDGFKPTDFERCCVQRGPTLTLIQVVGEDGREFVFGGFLAVSWPQRPAEGQPLLTIADPSGRSFLFSLANAYDRPFRLSLRDRQRAAQLWPSGCIGFGAEEYSQDCYVNLVLFSGGRPAKGEEANYSNGHTPGECAYTLDDWPAGQPPRPDFLLDEKTLAGTEDFAAKEIEVYAFGQM